MKICPHCAEPVKTEASKCKHCGSALVVDAKAVEAQDRNRKTVGIVAGMVVSLLLAYWLFIPITIRNETLSWRARVCLGREPAVADQTGNAFTAAAQGL